MYKNQLQELAQRSCFNLPSYACIREGPDHAPRFKASVNFNGEIFEARVFSTTVRQAEHAAAEVALSSLSARGPSRSLTARVLDETGVYKNLLQETAHRAGLKLPLYTTIRSGPGHVPVFTSTVELAGMNFTGESAKTKKQAEKNAAIAAWSALKKMPKLGCLSQTSKDSEDHQDHVIVGRVLSTLGRRYESRVVRRRDQFQPRGRMQQRVYRDNNNTNNSAQNQLWKFIDSFSDSSLENYSKKQSIFLSLLPPPPPRTISKILPPNLSNDSPPIHQSKPSFAPAQTMGNSQVKLQDDHKWINKISEAIKNKPTVALEGPSSSRKSINNPFPQHAKLNFPLPDRNTSQNSRTLIAKSELKGLYGSNNQMGGSTFGGGYHQLRIAPAVQIRSVIPVCAAPPVRLRSSNPKSTSSSSSSAEQELASNLSKLNL